jgi:lysophospholipase L1-like esterase
MIAIKIFWIALIYIWLSFVLFFVYIIKSIKLAKVAKNFVRYSGSPIIAFFGDSTGYGVGASCPSKTLAGLVGEKNLRSTVINDCKNGASIGKTIEILKHQKRFDVIFLCCGGIDILRFKKYSQIQKDVKELLEVASTKSDNIIFVTPINLGLSMAFPWFLKIVFWNRSNKVGMIIKKETKRFSKIVLINNLLISDIKSIPLHKNVSAPDRIHPNDDGYAWVFNKLKAKVNIEGLNL